MLKFWLSLKAQARRNDEGASAVEYGLLVAAIAAVIVVVVFLLGDVINGVFTETCTEISTEAEAGIDCEPEG